MTTRVALVTVFFAISFSAHAEWRFDAETGALYNSNLSKSDVEIDKENDWAWKTSARAGYGLQISRDLRLNLAGDLGAEAWSDFDGFNNIDLGSSAGLRYRFGLGRQAPWVSIENHLAYDFFNETVRNGWANDFQVTGGIAVTDRLSIEAFYLFDHFAARDDFFDLDGHRVGVRLIFNVTSALQLAVGYSYRHGDVISYAEPPRPDLLLLTSERQPVDSFGTSPRYTGYKLSGDTHAISVSASYTVTRNISVQVSYQYANTSHDPLTYENHFVETKIAFAY